MFTYKGINAVNVEFIKDHKGNERYYIRGLFSFGVTGFVAVGYLREFMRSNNLTKERARIALSQEAQSIKSRSIISPESVKVYSPAEVRYMFGEE